MIAGAAAAILAGGGGRRLGGVNKALLEVDGRPILERQLAVLRLLFRDIAVCAGEVEGLAGFGAEVLPDPVAGAGPLAGIAAALAWSPAPWVFVVAGDMPRLEARAIELLSARRGGASAVAPRVGGRPEPLFALYARPLAPEVERRLAAGALAPRALLLEAEASGLEVAWVEEDELRAVDPGLGFLAGVNTPADLAPTV